MPKMGKVFVSYSRKDNLPVAGEKESQVALFCRHLQQYLDAAYGRHVEVWWDKSLAGNEYFADSIDEVTGNSSMLVPIISPSYVADESGWLTRERERFIQGVPARGPERVGNYSRICPVLFKQVVIKDLPDAIKQLNLKHRFYDEENVSVTGQEYARRMQVLANELAKMLNLLNEVR